MERDARKQANSTAISTRAAASQIKKIELFNIGKQNRRTHALVKHKRWEGKTRTIFRLRLNIAEQGKKPNKNDKNDWKTTQWKLKSTRTMCCNCRSRSSSSNNMAWSLYILHRFLHRKTKLEMEKNLPTKGVLFNALQHIDLWRELEREEKTRTHLINALRSAVERVFSSRFFLYNFQFYYCKLSDILVFIGLYSLIGSIWMNLYVLNE